MIWIETHTEGNITQRFQVQDLSADRIRKLARTDFQAESNVGKIKGEYGDPVWILYTEGRYPVRIRFDKDKEKVLQVMPRSEYDDFIEDVKTMVMLRFGTCNQNALKAMAHYIIDVCCVSDRFSKIVIPDDKAHGSSLMYLINFLKSTRWGTGEFIRKSEDKLCTIKVSEAEERKNKDTDRPCVMNEFMSYFKFGEILKDAWQKEMTDLQKCFYFPLYFFWILTTVLPLRVMEFCVIPFDCLSVKDDRYYLAIRRTRLKGSSAKDIHIHYYTIKDDYDLELWEITKEYYDLLTWWKQISGGFEHPFGLLWSADYTKSLKYRKIAYPSDTLFDTEMLRSMLAVFYEEWVIDRHGMNIVDEEVLMVRYLDQETGSYEMYRDEIMVMRPKQTRHLAMINLIMWGCNPMNISHFAGHEGPSEDANYYGNTSKMVRCAVRYYYEKCRKYKTVYADEIHRTNNMTVFLDLSAPFVEIDEGKCYSPAKVKGSADDCMIVNGECQVCRYAYLSAAAPPSKKEQEEIDTEMKYLLKLLRNPELDANLSNLNQIVLRLQSKISDFAAKQWAYWVKLDQE